MRPNSRSSARKSALAALISGRFPALNKPAESLKAHRLVLKDLAASLDWRLKAGLRAGKSALKAAAYGGSLKWLGTPRQRLDGPP